MSEDREGPKAARELTLTERVDQQAATITRQGDEIEHLKNRTNELRRQLRKVIPDFTFDDEPKDMKAEVPYHGSEGRSSRTGRDGFG